jgi:Uma2 family endonuclease
VKGLLSYADRHWTRQSRPGWHVRAGKPVRLPPISKPEPDRSVVRGEVGDYSNHSPGAADKALVVEIAVSSLADDRIQAGVYAAACIPCYWIVNVSERQVEVYSGPSSAGYSSRVEFLLGQNVTVLIDGVQVGVLAVDDVLP